MKCKGVTVMVLLCCVLGCASPFFTIDSSFKRIKHAGVSSGKSFIEYTIEFNSETEFLIDKVSLQSDKNYDFSLFSIEKKNYVKPKEKQAKGKYVLTFTTNKIQQIDDQEEVLLDVVVAQKIQQQKIPVIKKKAFRGR